MKTAEFYLLFFFFTVTCNSVTYDQKPETLTMTVDPGVQFSGPSAALLWTLCD